MISTAHPTASWFLLLAAVFFAVAFVGPILLAPLRWAKVMQWSLPEDTDLTVYFGRCLGAFAKACSVPIGMPQISGRIDPVSDRLLQLFGFGETTR